MRITVLSSGSRGNATLVEVQGARLLIDAGVAYRELQARAQRSLGRPIENVDGILITHAHSDHSGQASALSQRFSAPLYMTEATRRCSRLRRDDPIETFRPRSSFWIGPLNVQTLPIPHDVPQIAVLLEHVDRKAALVTDLGKVKVDLLDALRSCGAILIESNYDPKMLDRGPYPARLKARVRSGVGHLSNRQTAQLLKALDHRTQTIVLMHLSQTNNRPEIAKRSAQAALRGRPVELLVASQNDPLCLEVPAAAGQMSLPLLT